MAQRSLVGSSPYPEDRAGRDSWVKVRRPAKRPVDPRRAAGWLLESEPDGRGGVLPTLTVFLTNRECPWRCVYCDLWRETTDEPVVEGMIPGQWDGVLGEAGEAGRQAEQVKLYNAGSFFDRAAIPEADHAGIAARMTGRRRVIVESHPALVGDSVWRFEERLSGVMGQPRLEVAMGLETVNETVLERLNKGMTLETFARAAKQLTERGVGLRAFVLVQPPFEEPGEAVAWAVRSAEFAFDQGAGVVSLIPVRGGNGALEALRQVGRFEAPGLSVLEAALEGALALGKRGRVLADTWDLERLARCPACFEARRQRLAVIHLRQQTAPPVKCEFCGGSGRG